MRFCSFWQGLREKALSGTVFCTGQREGLREFLEVLGELLYSQQFSLSFEETPPLYNQSSLWQDDNVVVWTLHVFAADPKEKKNPKKLTQAELQGATQNCNWLFFEKKEELLPHRPDRVWTIEQPSSEEWALFVKHYLPHVDSALSTPQDLFQAAFFLKSLALTGHTGAACSEQMDGSGWDKFFYLLRYKPALTIQPISISDLIHISHCIDAIHQKGAMPSKVMRFCPQPLSAIFSDRKLLIQINTKTMPHYIEMLIAMNLLDQDRANRALSRWITSFLQFFDKAP